MLKINMNLCFINVYIYKLQSNNIFLIIITFILRYFNKILNKFVKDF